jgi:hypothetical protein
MALTGNGPTDRAWEQQVAAQAAVKPEGKATIGRTGNGLIVLETAGNHRFSVDGARAIITKLQHQLAQVTGLDERHIVDDEESDFDEDEDLYGGDEDDDFDEDDDE